VGAPFYEKRFRLFSGDLFSKEDGPGSGEEACAADLVAVLDVVREVNAEYGPG